MAFMLIPESGVEEELSWKTDILISYNGTEQRLSLIEEPRVRLKASFFLNQSDRRKIEREINERIKTVSVVPVWQYTARLAASTGSGGTRIYFSQGSMSLNDGQYVALIDLRTKEVYSHTIANVETDGVTLNETLTTDVDRNFIVMPAMLATIDGANYGWQIVTGEITLSFDSYEDNLLLDENNSVTLTTLNGLPVITETFLEGTGDDKLFEFEVLDNEIGKREYRTRHTLVRTQGDRTFTLDRYRQTDKIQWWRKFLNTVKGAWKPFYISTQLEDLVTPNNSSAADDYILIDDLDYEYSEAFGAIEILYGDGSVSYHTIDNGNPDPIPVIVGEPFETDYVSIAPQNQPGVTILGIDTGRVTAQFEVQIDWFHPDGSKNTDNSHALDMDFYDAGGLVVTNNTFSTFNDTAGGVVTDVLDPLTRDVRVRSRNQSTFGWTAPDGDGFATALVSEVRFVLGSDLHDVDGVTYKALSIDPALPDDSKVENIVRVSYLLKARMADTVVLNHDHRDTEVSITILSTNEG